MHSFSLAVEAAVVAAVREEERKMKINPEMKTGIKMKWENWDFRWNIYSEIENRVW